LVIGRLEKRPTKLIEEAKAMRTTVAVELKKKELFIMKREREIIFGDLFDLIFAR